MEKRLKANNIVSFCVCNDGFSICEKGNICDI